MFAKKAPVPAAVPEREATDSPPPAPAPEISEIPAAPRRIGELAGVGRRRDAETESPEARPEREVLRVGAGLSLTGSVDGCAVLLVEGQAELSASKIQRLSIAPQGKLTGDIDCAEAEIAGHFTGTLVVSGKLVLRAQGRVSGTVRYGALEVAHGGQISGNIQPQTADA